MWKKQRCIGNIRILTSRKDKSIFILVSCHLYMSKMFWVSPKMVQNSY